MTAPMPPHVPPPGSPPPSEPPPQPAGPQPSGPGRVTDSGRPWPTAPGGPTGPGRTPTPRELEILQARYAAAVELIHVTDHARELRKVNRLTDIDRAEVAFVEKAWDAVNPSPQEWPATREQLDQLIADTFAAGAS